MIKLKSVYKVYHNANGDYDALKDITIEFPRKGLCIIEGNSGSGKTTLLNIIAGIDKEFSGHLVYDGREISIKDIDNYRSTHIALSSQFFGLLETFTVKENLIFACELSGVNYSDKLAGTFLAEVNLPDDDTLDVFLNKKINELSGGQKQRLSIARALMKTADVFIFDEPTSSVDENNRDFIIKALKKRSERSLVIVSSHDSGLLKHMNTYVARLENGVLTSFCKGGFAETKGAFLTVQEQKQHRLSFKNCFLFSSRTYKNDWKKTIFSMLLTVLSVLFLSLSLMLGFSDANEANMRSMARQDSRFGFLYSYQLDDAMGLEDHYSLSPFTEDEISLISEHSSFYPVSIFDLSFCFEQALWTAWNTNEALLYSTHVNLIDVAGENNPSNLGLSGSELCSVAGRLPKNSDEIALTDFMASIILNHKNEFPGITFDSNVNRLEDFIGTRMTIKIDGFMEVFEDKTITGVFSCDDRECTSLLSKDVDFSNVLLRSGVTRDLLSAKYAGNSILKSIFVYENCTNFSKLITRFSTNVSKESLFLETLNVVEGRRIELNNKHSGVSSYMDSIGGWVEYFSLFIGLTFGLVSFILIARDIAERTQINNKNIGILKTIGATGRDVYGVALAHNVPYYLLTALITSIITYISKIIINRLISLEYLAITPVFAVVIIMVFVVLSLIVTLIESIKVSLVNITDIINEKIS